MSSTPETNIRESTIASILGTTTSYVSTYAAAAYTPENGNYILNVFFFTFVYMFIVFMFVFVYLCLFMYICGLCLILLSLLDFFTSAPCALLVPNEKDS